jgi:uncharacterized protein (TIGR03435 family)
LTKGAVALNRFFIGLSALVLLVNAAGGQTASAPVAFEAADVHASPERLHPEMHGSLRGGRVSLRDATLADLIATSYHVDPADVFGGPSWLDFDRFDINAKAAANTSDEAGVAMLRGLLADRFQLMVHTDKRPLPAFVLSVGKLNRMKQSAASADAGQCQYQQPAPNAAMPAPGAPPPPIKFSCHNTTMETLADFLHNVGSPYLTRPVVDQTGLKGGWDFDLQWNYNKPKDGGGISLFDAVDKQLGLKLESKPTPTAVVVVDSVNEKPTPNVAGLDKILPPSLGAEFEVAVIREAGPDERHFNIEVEGNRVNIHYATLQTLIYTSFETQPGKIENKPKWLDDVHYDIMGTVAMNNASAAIPGADSGLDTDDIDEMVRSLLADRFKLATHAGSQPSVVYALVADGPKMKKADPANHPTCHEGPGPDGKDPRVDNPLLKRLISCQNMTMAQFASELHTLAGGYLPAPVIDSTGLAGAYDFTLSFSKGVDLKTAAAAPPSASGDGPSDPGPIGISLFDAVEKQLGLKLEKKDKVMMPTLVIDHVEEKPTEN